jgi:serine/threonine protein kinase/Tfp pilus assembly protein PilF
MICLSGQFIYLNITSVTIFSPFAYNAGKAHDESMIGQLISHYKIIQKLGQGGLGEVFLAEDTILNRRVALKFLAKTDDETAHHQIIAEARSAALIDHPYACKVFEAGQVEGKSFIVMEYVEGGTLAEKIKAGKIRFQDAMKIAIEMSEALADAHGKGIVHCDLKPANVMIARSGHVKLMDFGLARLVTGRNTSGNQDETEQMTISGVNIVGTPAYMSPENARGDNLDARTDVFAFGIMLFEMLAGFHPFRRKTPQATIAAILHEEPPRIEEFVHTLSPELAQTLRRALAKDPDDRYPTARELWADLTQSNPEDFQPNISTDRLDSANPSDGKPLPAIAILPFTDFSPDSTEEYLCFGLAEDLITTLGKLDGLKVASRTASFRYKSVDADVQEIGTALKVTSLLEGSVQKAGDRMRIVVKLVDVSTGFPVWSEKFDRKMDDVFEVQDEISHAIVEKLRVTLTLPSYAKLHREPRNVRAYEFYLKGRFRWNKRTEENLKLSIEQFELALQEDPNYDLAYCGIADAYITLSLYGALPPIEALPLARDAADRALEISPDMPEALTARACVRAIFDWDWKVAAQEFEAAIRLNPKNAQARLWYAINCLAPIGEIDRAKSELVRAAEIEPVSLPIGTALGILSFFQRNYDDAMTQFRAVLSLDNTFYLAHYFLGLTYAELCLYEESQRELEAAAELAPGSPETEAALGYKGALARRWSDAQYAMESLTRRGKQRYVSPVLLAQLSSASNAYDAALANLEAAYQLRSTDLIWINLHPAFEGIRSDTRFLDLTYKIGLVKTEQSIHQNLTSRSL